MEIGSEFSNIFTNVKQGDCTKWLPCADDHALVFSGRTAIDMVLRDIGNNAGKALLPSYCCASMVEPFLKAGYDVEFYQVGVGEGMFIQMDIPNHYSVLLLCNYFGFRTDYPEEEIRQFRRRGGVVIEDITHSLFSEEQFRADSDYLVASLRKWGAVLSGGFCSKRNGRFIEKPKSEPDLRFLQQKEEAMLLKEKYLRDGDSEKKNRYLKFFAESNQWLAEHWAGLAMDKESETALSGWDPELIRIARKNNAKTLYQGLEQCPGIAPLFPLEKMDCPLFVPVCVDAKMRDSVRQRLIEEEIYCPVHWPKPCGECASPLYDTELSLICDQRYNEEDMRRILSVLQAI